MSQAKEMIQTVRTALLMTGSVEKVFFATLVLRLQFVETTQVETMATDGDRVFYNPQFVEGCSLETVEFVICHELLHVVLRHAERLAGCSDPYLKNVAADLADNSVLIDAGFSAPSDALVPGEGEFVTFERGLSAEEYLAILTAQAQAGPSTPPPSQGTPMPLGSQGQGQDGEPGETTPQDASNSAPGGQDAGGGQTDGPAQDGATGGESGASGGGSGDKALDLAAQAPDPGRCGTFVPGDQGDTGKAELEVAVIQAAKIARQVAEKAGQDVPALVESLVASVTEQPRDWREILADHLSARAKNDYTWSRPNRRSLGSGVILPGMYSDELGAVVVAIDTSGSVSRAEVVRFCGEMEDLLGHYDCQATILFHHTRIWREVEWEPCDGEIEIPTEIESGGTSHVPVMARVQDIDPVLFVGFTDGYTRFDSSQGEPDCGVIWAMPNSHKKPPFGEIINLEAA